MQIAGQDESTEHGFNVVAVEVGTLDQRVGGVGPGDPVDLAAAAVHVDALRAVDAADQRLHVVALVIGSLDRPRDGVGPVDVVEIGGDGFDVEEVAAEVAVFDQDFDAVGIVDLGAPDAAKAAPVDIPLTPGGDRFRRCGHDCVLRHDDVVPRRHVGEETFHTYVVDERLPHTAVGPHGEGDGARRVHGQHAQLAGDGRALHCAACTVRLHEGCLRGQGADQPRVGCVEQALVAHVDAIGEWLPLHRQIRRFRHGHGEIHTVYGLFHQVGHIHAVDDLAVVEDASAEVDAAEIAHGDGGIVHPMQAVAVHEQTPPRAGRSRCRGAGDGHDQLVVVAVGIAAEDAAVLLPDDAATVRILGHGGQQRDAGAHGAGVGAVEVGRPQFGGKPVGELTRCRRGVYRPRQAAVDGIEIQIGDGDAVFAEAGVVPRRVAENGHSAAAVEVGAADLPVFAPVEQVGLGVDGEGRLLVVDGGRRQAGDQILGAASVQVGAADAPIAAVGGAFTPEDGAVVGVHQQIVHLVLIVEQDLTVAAVEQVGALDLPAPRPLIPGRPVDLVLSCGGGGATTEEIARLQGLRLAVEAGGCAGKSQAVEPLRITRPPSPPVAVQFPAGDAVAAAEESHGGLVEVLILDGGHVAGGSAFAEACVLYINRKARGQGVDFTLPLRPIATAIVAVAARVRAAHVNLVEIFQPQRHHTRPRTGDAAAVQRQRLPAAEERGHVLCGEGDGVDGHFVEHAVEEGRACLWRKAQVEAVLCREGRRGDRPLRLQLTVNVERMAVGADGLHHLMPRSVGEVAAGGTDLLHPTTAEDVGADVAAAEEEVAIVAEDIRRNAFVGGGQPAVGAGGVEPERKAVSAFGQLDGGDVEVDVRAGEAPRHAVAPVTFRRGAAHRTADDQMIEARGVGEAHGVGGIVQG